MLSYLYYKNLYRKYINYKDIGKKVIHTLRNEETWKIKIKRYKQ